MREIVIACGDYDRTSALKEHQLSLDGAPYQYLTISPPSEIFWRMLKYEEFDVSEMSLGSYCTAVARGDRRFVAIPAFPSRVFRHGNLYVPASSPLRDPSELKGCRIGVEEYEMTAGIWIRGFLNDDYGVSARDVRWVLGRKEKVAGIPCDPAIEVSFNDKLDLEAALEQGDIDALMTTFLPAGFPGRVRRLLPGYQEAEEDYFRRTGIFPIMHTIVMRRALYEEHPWLARGLFKAFTQAKEMAQRDMYRPNTLRFTLPWLVASIERTRAIMGEDPWPYGLEANLPTLRAFSRHLVEQGLTKRLLTLEEIFVPADWTNKLV